MLTLVSGVFSAFAKRHIKVLIFQFMEKRKNTYIEFDFTNLSALSLIFDFMTFICSVKRKKQRYGNGSRFLYGKTKKNVANMYAIS